MMKTLVMFLVTTTNVFFISMVLTVLPFFPGSLRHVRNDPFVTQGRINSADQLKLSLQDEIHQPGLSHEVRWHDNQDQRIMMLDDQADISGEWHGYLTICEADLITRYIEDVIVQILRSPIIQLPLESIFGETLDETQARDAAQAGIETPGVGVEFPLELNITGYDHSSGEFSIRITEIEEDGSKHSTRTQGQFNRGLIAFDVRYPDGFVMKYEGMLVSNNTMRGVFTGSIGFMPDALSGAWEVSRGGSRSVYNAGICSMDMGVMEIDTNGLPLGPIAIIGGLGVIAVVSVVGVVGGVAVVAVKVIGGAGAAGAGAGAGAAAAAGSYGAASAAGSGPYHQSPWGQNLPNDFIQDSQFGSPSDNPNLDYQSQRDQC